MSLIGCEVRSGAGLDLSSTMEQVDFLSNNLRWSYGPEVELWVRGGAMGPRWGSTAVLEARDFHFWNHSPSSI